MVEQAASAKRAHAEAAREAAASAAEEADAAHRRGHGEGRGKGVWRSPEGQELARIEREKGAEVGKELREDFWYVE